MAEKVLEVVAPKIILETEKDFNPKDYFKDRTELLVFSSFEERVLSKADSILPFKITIASSKLLERANDKEIEAELPYTKSCVVDVGWNKFDGGWYVVAWDRFDGQWLADGRVFSPATESSTTLYQEYERP